MDARHVRTDLFPELDPFRSGLLPVDNRHVIYWEQSGHPQGLPVLFLHGGPGAGAAPAHRRFFDPRVYRIVVLDQRGCGRSLPYGETTDNTTQHLIADIERVRQHLRIDRWLLFGGSWGSTLALAYGIAHPDRCLGFILRGIFLGSRREIDWFLYGMRAVFPEAWRRFSGFLPEGERDDLLTHYHRRLTDPDPAIHQPAAHAWSRYETMCSNLIPRGEELGAGNGHAALTLARLEAHYFVHDVFLPRDHILARIERLRRLPAVIVQGRYDMVCPIVTADRLARAWPEAAYQIVPDAGHSAMEPGVRSALVRAGEMMKLKLDG